MPFGKMVQNLGQTFRREPHRSVRFGVIASVSVTAFIGVAWGTPWPGGRSAPAFVEYAPLTVVRADTDGFIEEVLIEEGQVVEKGDHLVTLQNDELVSECQQLELEILQSDARRRVYVKQDEIASSQIETKQIEALQKRLAERSRQREQLIVKAPMSGRIAGRNLDELRGSFIKEGTEIFTIGNESTKEVQLSIAQEDMDAFQANLKQSVLVVLPGHATLVGKVDRLQPRASVEPGSDALAAPNGGLLPVRVSEAEDDGETVYELIEPRFTGYVSLPQEESNAISPGRRCLATLAESDRSFGQGLYDVTSRWIAQAAEQTGLR